MEKLNEIIKSTIEEYEIIDIKEYDFLTKLNNIILKYDRKIVIPKYTNKVNIKKNFEYSESFLKSISLEYAEYLIKRKNEGAFNFVGADSLSRSDLVDGKKIIYLGVTGTIEDSYTITHEIIHDMSVDETYSLTRSLFCEVFSLLSEMLQANYYRQNNSPKDYLIDGKSTLVHLISKAKIIDFDKKLINQYLENGYITKIDLFNILKDYDNLDTIMDHLDVILDCEELTYDFELRYIIGYLFASYMYDRIINEPKKIREFIDLNDMINEYSIENLLNYLELDYSDSMYFDLTDESYQKLEESYIKQLKRI